MCGSFRKRHSESREPRAESGGDRKRVQSSQVERQGLPGRKTVLFPGADTSGLPGPSNGCWGRQVSN